MKLNERLLEEKKQAEREYFLEPDITAFLGEMPEFLLDQGEYIHVSYEHQRPHDFMVELSKRVPFLPLYYDLGTFGTIGPERMRSAKMIKDVEDAIERWPKLDSAYRYNYGRNKPVLKKHVGNALLEVGDGTASVVAYVEFGDHLLRIDVDYVDDRGWKWNCRGNTLFALTVAFSTHVVQYTNRIVYAKDIYKGDE